MSAFWSAAITRVEPSALVDSAAALAAQGAAYIVEASTRQSEPCPFAALLTLQDPGLGEL